MLLGEHAVLVGHPALITSIEKRIFVSLTPLQTAEIEIHSPLGQLQFSLSNFPTDYPPTHAYVLETLKHWLNQEAPTGLSLQITSDFEPGVGLGSSTAVVVATLKALNQLRRTPLSQQALFTLALQIIRQLQGQASGADVAASLYEGCLFYQNENATLLPCTPIIEWRFSGQKVPTRVALDHVASLDPEYRTALFEQIHLAVLMGKKALEEKNAQAFAMSLKTNQKLMERLFLDTPNLRQARKDLEQDPSVLATKISGAGLGDGIIGFKGFQTW